MGGSQITSTRKDEKVYSTLDKLPSEQLTNILLKAFAAREGFTLPIPSSISTNYEPDIKDARNWEEFSEWERAIHPISNYYNTLGIARPYFSKAANDVLATTPYYAICEKSICDYTAALEFGVYDKNNEHCPDMDEFLDYPGPQVTFGDVIKKSLPDITRYDAGCLVKTFDRRGRCVTFDSFLGTEFWKEIDRVPVGINLGHLPAAKQIGYYSHGHVKRYWQRSRTGVYVSFNPNELAYMSMYPRNDTIYGTDWLSALKAPIQYLIDSTRAAGKTFQNGVVPSLVYKHPQVTDRKQLMQRLADLRQNNQGPLKFGSTLHLVKDEEVETLSHKLHDMEWLEGQKFMAQLVWSMWGFQPQEFVGESANRATAYVSRNITKSKMLYPIMKYLEVVFTRDVLPYVDGYKKGMRFKFEIEQDLDDTMKVAETKLAQSQAAKTMFEMGIKNKDAARLAGLTKEHDVVEFDEISVMDLNQSQQLEGGKPSEPNRGKKTDQGKPDRNRGSQQKIKFGDKEERSAGIKKATTEIKLIGDDGAEITIVPAGPSVTTNRKGCSTEAARDITKEVRELTKHNRAMMRNPEVWDGVVAKAIEDFDLMLFLGEQ
jgi:hypothetical protein